MKAASSKENFMFREGGASEEEIIALETCYNITLPNDYREFLHKFGFVAWFGDYVCGLVEENARLSKSCNVYRKTDYYRDFYNRAEFQSVPTDGVIINQYDGGGYYFLFSQESERAGEVGLFLTETYGQEVSKFNTFIDYLSFLINDTPDPESVDVDYDKIMDIIED
ncbi:SMI1/KNR4 family protein [Pseudoalteromonas sp. AS84]